MASGQSSDQPHAEWAGRSAADTLKLWFKTARPFSFPASLVPAVTAVAAVRPMPDWRYDTLAATVISVLFLHAAGNMLNDYFDYVGGVDRRTEDDEGRPGRLLVKGLMEPAHVFRAAVAALVVAGLAAVYLAWRVDGKVFGFYGIAALGGYAYTGPPFRLKARALGEPAVFIIFGPALMAGACYVQTRGVPASVLLLSIPMGLAVSLILMGNNLRDMAEDAAGGARTVAHLLGQRRTARLYCAAAMACPLGMTAAGAAYGRPLMALTVLALPTMLKPMRAALSGQRLPDIDARTAKFTTALGAIATTVLAVSGGLG
jgi:1,4-dihydroxy-2-naphthoate octaprenyltransferase